MEDYSKTSGDETINRVGTKAEGDGINFELDKAVTWLERIQKTVAVLTEHLEPVLRQDDVGLKDSGETDQLSTGESSVARRVKNMTHTIVMLDANLQLLNQRVHL